MTLLSQFFLVSWILIFGISVSIARKERFNALHFWVFLLAGLSLIVFAFFPSMLDVIGKITWLPRGSDALVYTSIIFLWYFSLLLLRKVESEREHITRLVRELALHNSEHGEWRGDFVFLVRSFNEIKRIPETLRWILDAGFTQIIVVDDGSIDGTSTLLKNTFPGRIHFLKHLFNRGGWAALETGFEFVRQNASHYGWKWLVTFDADGQHDIKDMKVFLEMLKDHPKTEVIFGSRFIIKTDSNVPFLRRIILWWGKVFTSIISWVHLTDSHNGYRLFSIDSIRKIHLTMDGMEYASELIEQVRIHQLKWREVPVNIHYDEYSLGKWQKSSNALNIAIRMIWKKFFS